jgi:hypothetical protein
MTFPKGMTAQKGRFRPSSRADFFKARTFDFFSVNQRNQTHRCADTGRSRHKPLYLPMFDRRDQAGTRKKGQIISECEPADGTSTAAQK